MSRWVLLAAALAASVAWAGEADPRSKFWSASGDQRAEGGLPLDVKDVNVIENLGEKIPLDLAFTDHTGKAVHLGDYFKDHVRPKVIVGVYFTCPTLCTTILQGIVGSLRATGLKLGDDYDIITYSIDPKDTPARAAEKRKALIDALGYSSSTAEWPFLVGDEATTKRLASALGFKYKYDASLKQYAHNAVFMILTPEGAISRYVYGVRFPPKDVRLALVEASQGRVGTAFDRFLLTCYRYDPATRRYGLVVETVIKGGGSLVFAALLIFFIVFWRRELKHKKPPTTPPEGARP